MRITYACRPKPLRPPGSALNLFSGFRLSDLGSRVHIVEYDLFIKKSTCPTGLPLVPCLVQIWSRNTPHFGPNETFGAHRVERGHGLSPSGISPESVPGNRFPLLGFRFRFRVECVGVLVSRRGEETPRSRGKRPLARALHTVEYDHFIQSQLAPRD